MARASCCILAAWTCAVLTGCVGETEFPALSLTKYDKEVIALAIDPTGTTLATASEQKPVTGVPGLLFWDLRTGQSKGGYEVGIAAKAICYSKNGKRVLTTRWDDSTLTVWDADTAKPIFHLDGKGPQFLCDAAFAPDGKTVATSDGKQTIRLWDVDTGKERLALEGHAAKESQVVTMDLAFSPDGKLLASTSEREPVRLWDVAAQKCVASFNDYKGYVQAIAFSPDGGVLAAGGEDGNVILWDVSTLKRRSTIAANYESMNQIAFQPDGKHLAVVGARAEAVADKGEEGAITFFDTATGKAGQVLIGTQKNAFCCISFSPDGKLLAAGSASTEQPITVWEQDEHGAWKRKW